MATLYVSEFVSQGTDPNGKMQSSAQQPPLQEQTVAIGVSSAQTTNAFTANTTLVRLHADAICSVAVGANPTASATKMRMAANQTEYFTVPNNSGFKAAVITNT
jgi:hypothetical protein